MQIDKQNMLVAVDMDGTVADLFSAVSLKLFNKQYKDITPEEKAEAKKIWYDKAHFVDNFGDVEEFFATLPPFGKNGEITNAIIDTVIKNVGSYSICSHPASIDVEACKRGKITWIKKYLQPQPTEMLFPQSKAIYAINKETGKPNVLIDDFPPYIKAWRDAGGIAIEMRTDSFNTPEQIKTFLTKELNAAKEQIDGPIKESFDSYVELLLSTFIA
jgi:5'(3')-deoxyribonucleotidase